MANDAKNVGGGKFNASGYLYAAPAGTTLPTSATGTLASEYQCIGYCSEDGFKIGRETSTEDIKDANGTVVNSEATDHKETLNFNMIEVNANALKEFYGQDNVEVDTATNKITVHSGAYDMPSRVFILEAVLPDNRLGRYIFPSVKVTEWEDQELKAGEAIKYGVTGTCSPYTWTSGTKTWSDCYMEYIEPKGSTAANANKSAK